MTDKPTPASPGKVSKYADSLATFLAYGVDLLNRHIFLNGDVGEEEIGLIIMGIKNMELLDPKRKITIHIDTFGGDLYEMFNLHDTMRSSSCPISTIASGKTQSAGVLLAASGDTGERSANLNTWFMLHCSTASGEEYEGLNASQIMAEAIHHAELDKTWYKLLSERSNKSAGFWKKYCEQPKNSYFSAKQAEEFGLIDKIIATKKLK